MHKIKKALPWILAGAGAVGLWWLMKKPALVMPPVNNPTAPVQNQKTNKGLPATAVAASTAGTAGAVAIGKWQGILHGTTAQIFDPLSDTDAGWLFDTFPGLVSVVDSNGTVFSNR